MALLTLAELRSNIATTTRETNINSTIDEYINLSLTEINDPAWAFEQVNERGYNHLWTFNKRKNTFATVASTEFYQLPRDVDKISLIRQITSPVKVKYVPDEIFYRYIPNPTATGTPYYYRIWEEEGLSTRLTSAGTIDAVSSDAADGSTFTVSVVGYDSNGIVQSEVLTLNGVTKVTGSQTFAASKPIRVSKSGKTTGNITITTGSTTLLVLGEEERSPRFKVIGLYPIPSSVITMYLEYYTRIRRVVNNADVPDIDEKWVWVVRLGAMAKVYQYQGKESMYQSTQLMYGAGVRSMVRADMQEPDYIPHLASHNVGGSGRVNFSDETPSSPNYGGSYGLNF